MCVDICLCSSAMHTHSDEQVLTIDQAKPGSLLALVVAACRRCTSVSLSKRTLIFIIFFRDEKIHLRIYSEVLKKWYVVYRARLAFALLHLEGQTCNTD